MKEPTELFNGMTVRSGTTDIRSLKEVNHAYRALDITERSVVLDVGGNIGGFARQAAERGARLVVTVEPDANNYRLLKKNTAKYPSIIALNAALIIGAEKTITLYTMDPARYTSRGSHSIVPTRGRIAQTVEALNFAKLLKDVRPSIIKMDCEGAEYELLQTPLPSYVKQISMEWHFRSVHPIAAYEALEKKALLDRGFRPDRAYPPPTLKAWQIVRTYKR